MTFPDKYSLAGKSPVVTGAGNGIGRAIALAFADAGAAVACVDLDMDAAGRTSAAIRKTEAQAFPVQCNVSSEATVELAIKDILTKFPSVEILVNGAATYDPNGTVLDLTIADWNKWCFFDEPRNPAGNDRRGRWQYHSYRFAAWYRCRAAAFCLLRHKGRPDSIWESHGD